jgi:hypothetical protein
MGHEAQVPVLRMVEVGEAALGQGAYEVEGQGGPAMAEQQARRVGGARRAGELGAIDQVAAITGQSDAIPGLQVRRSWLGVLAGDAPDPDHPLLQALHQNQAHLEQNLELVGDDVRLAVGETLGAVAPLEQEAIAPCRRRQLFPQGMNLPGGDQGRQGGQFRQGGLQGRLIRVAGLLQGGDASARRRVDQPGLAGLIGLVKWRPGRRGRPRRLPH